MPQFDTRFFPSQIFWVCVCFGTLWMALHFWVVPKLRFLQKSRLEALSKLREQAAQLQEKSANLQAQVVHQKKALEAQIQARVHATQVAQEKRYAAHFEELRQQFDEEMEQAREKVKQLQENFLTTLKVEAQRSAQWIAQQYQKQGKQDHEA